MANQCEIYEPWHPSSCSSSKKSNSSYPSLSVGGKYSGLFFIFVCGSVILCEPVSLADVKVMVRGGCEYLSLSLCKSPNFNYVCSLEISPISGETIHQNISDGCQRPLRGIVSRSF